MLVAELKKIELRKKEREKKQQDLQKLITAAEQNVESRKTQKRSNPKKTKSGGGGMGSSVSTPKLPSEAALVFKTYDKSSGASLRSSKIKFPLTLGQKKTKTIEQVLEELSVELRPMPTEQVCLQFNELRNDILLLLELKAASDVCDFELQSLKHRDEALPFERQLKTPSVDSGTPSQKKSSLQFMEVVSQAAQGRKRRTTVLESALKKRKV
ncbi:PREDICTED: DNA methyltransferase 1-associated protein 1-like [Amphimedon queenslandica]|uniref:DNA methyltransferase 1-associated 1 domain-containing protein n=1 Tax=Amphimedon queenslandica TaxID=400682 RepID=A0AAN0IQD8_AMPQE|nr:PREDICTED: DNA methyltransferase 1-associated protein 1-like [Amphimedon queenslandica]|eukprot:XP_011407433.1 PREDICTED: DNA methyltransferase 1-associated protein 1-like [Amphimedon queenslandica]